MEKMELGMLQHKINSNFWRNKRVLVTGHTGFKGSWISLWLHSMGAKLRGIALLPPTTPALFDLIGLKNIIDHQVADIRDYEKINLLVSNFQPEIIFHMAAQPLVRLSYHQPAETYSTNLMGTVNIFEAARNAKSVRAIVNITSDKCYENNEWIWGYRENDSMGGHDPYSNSKGCSELISNAYRKSFLTNEGIAMATARAGNVIGGGDWAHERLIPDILNSLEKCIPIQIRNPNAIRPWQHVLEPLSGYLMLAELLYEEGHVYAEGWNFGPRDDDIQTVQRIVEKICSIWGRNAGWVLQNGHNQHEATYLKLDISKAKYRLHWIPRWSLQTALEKVVEWHQAWMNGSDMRALSLEQISQYQEL